MLDNLGVGRVCPGISGGRVFGQLDVERDLSWNLGLVSFFHKHCRDGGGGGVTDGRFAPRRRELNVSMSTRCMVDDARVGPRP